MVERSFQYYDTGVCAPANSMSKAWPLQHAYTQQFVSTCVTGANLTAEQPPCARDQAFSAIIDKTWETHRAESLDCCMKLGLNEFSIVASAQETTRDNRQTTMIMLLVCVACAFITSIICVAYIKFVYNLLSTYAGSIDWNLKQVLYDDTARDILLQCMTEKRDEESLLFWLAVRDFKVSLYGGKFKTPEHAHDRLAAIVTEFVRPGAEKQVNLSAEDLKAISDKADAKDWEEVLKRLLSARRAVFYLMATNDLHPLLAYGPFIEYADRRNKQLIHTIAAAKGVGV